MCEELCTSFIYSLFPFCKSSGASCCACNPSCCKSLCTCGFHEDDDRFNNRMDRKEQSSLAPPTPAPGGGTTSAQGVQQEYGRKEMSVPQTAGAA